MAPDVARTARHRGSECDGRARRGSALSAPAGLRAELLRRKPVRSTGGQHAAGEHGEHLPRSIGTFQLTMFGVGATVGTGIFFVLSSAVPEAGPAVILAFVMAGIPAGPAPLFYPGKGPSLPGAGRTQSPAYPAPRGDVADGGGRRPP